MCDMFESTSGGIRGLTTHPLEVELTDVARIFVQLQEARHLADYDLAAVFDRDQVLNYVDKTQLAMEKWKAIKNTPNANVFLTALLLHGRWSKWNK